MEHCVTATLCIRNVREPIIGFHDEPTDDTPYAFVDVGSRVSLWSENPEDFRRIAKAMTDTAIRLEKAIERREDGSQQKAQDVNAPQ